MKDFFEKSGWMVDEFGWFRSYVPCCVKTAWGVTNKSARFVKGTGLAYFKTKSGAWLNYEPQQVLSITPL